MKSIKPIVSVAVVSLIACPGCIPSIANTAVDTPVDIGAETAADTAADTPAEPAADAAPALSPASPAPQPRPLTQPATRPSPSPSAPMPPAPLPEQAQEPRPTNYLDAPQTLGNWRYARSGRITQAVFSAGATTHLAFTCLGHTQQIRIMREAPEREARGEAQREQYQGQRRMQITTETGEKTLAAHPMPSQPHVVAADIAVSDPFLDAMAITKGRFAVETEGMDTLYLPAWAEVSRVIEDCR